MHTTKQSMAYKAHARKIVNNGAMQKELIFINKMVSYLHKSKVGRACRVVEKRKVALFWE